MLIRQAGALLLVARAACGLRDSSPFFLLSTEALRPDTLHNAQISTASSLEDRVIDGLADCSASMYVLVNQPGLSAADLRDGNPMPKMRRRIENTMYKSVVQIPEVIGEADAGRLAERLGRKCGIEPVNLRDFFNNVDTHGNPAVLTFGFPAIHPDQHARTSALEEADSFLEYELSTNIANNSHVLIYTSTPPSVARNVAEQENYDMEDSSFPSAMHSDLKRDAPYLHTRQSDNPQNGLPLFEKYKFLSPGIFMGLLVTILLSSIVYVGVSAISGLEVSYMAFSKEMGPQAQQKSRQ